MSDERRLLLPVWRRAARHGMTGGGAWRQRRHCGGGSGGLLVMACVL